MEDEKIQAITFDVGGTLIEPWPSVGHVYARAAARLGFPDVNPEELSRHFAEAWQQRGAFDYSRPAWQRLVEETFAATTGRQPDDACFTAIYETFGQAPAWRVFDDVLPALRSVRRSGQKLGIISNWDERLVPLLQQLQLASLFDVVVVSHEAGQTKPSGKIFQLAASRLHLAPACFLHIGDSASEDVAGARAAGMQSLLLNRKAAESDGAVISSLEFIPQH